MARALHLAARLPGSLCHTALQFQIYPTIAIQARSTPCWETVGLAQSTVNAVEERSTGGQAYQGAPGGQACQGPAKKLYWFQGSHDLEEQLATEPTALLCNFRLDWMREHKNA